MQQYGYITFQWLLRYHMCARSHVEWTFVRTLSVCCSKGAMRQTGCMYVCVHSAIVSVASVCAAVILLPPRGCNCCRWLSPLTHTQEASVLSYLSRTRVCGRVSFNLFSSELSTTKHLPRGCSSLVIYGVAPPPPACTQQFLPYPHLTSVCVTPLPAAYTLTRRLVIVGAGDGGAKAGLPTARQQVRQGEAGRNHV